MNSSFTIQQLRSIAEKLKHKCIGDFSSYRNEKIAYNQALDDLVSLVEVALFSVSEVSKARNRVIRKRQASKIVR